MILVSAFSSESGVSKHRALGALLVAPWTEQILRAAMIACLRQRGVFWCVGITSGLMAVLHRHPAQQLILQSILSILFLYSGESILLLAITHSALNAIVVWQAGIS